MINCLAVKVLVYLEYRMIRDRIEVLQLGTRIKYCCKRVAQKRVYPQLFRPERVNHRTPNLCVLVRVEGPSGCRHAFFKAVHDAHDL